FRLAPTTPRRSRSSTISGSASAAPRTSPRSLPPLLSLTISPFLSFPVLFRYLGFRFRWFSVSRLVPFFFLDGSTRSKRLSARIIPSFFKFFPVRASKSMTVDFDFVGKELGVSSFSYCLVGRLVSFSFLMVARERSGCRRGSSRVVL
ncbi:unnamed protein product, partial [Musa acuminata subsp. burmannicoides]